MRISFVLLFSFLVLPSVDKIHGSVEVVHKEVLLAYFSNRSIQVREDKSEI